VKKRGRLNSRGTRRREEKCSRVGKIMGGDSIVGGGERLGGEDGEGRENIIPQK